MSRSEQRKPSEGGGFHAKAEHIKNHLTGCGFQGMEQEEHHFAMGVCRIHNPARGDGSARSRDIGLSALIKRTRCFERAHVGSESWCSSTRM